MVSNSINSRHGSEPNDGSESFSPGLPTRSEVARRLTPLIKFFHSIHPGEPVVVTLAEKTLEGCFVSLDERLLRVSLRAPGAAKLRNVDLLDIGSAARLESDSPNFNRMFDQRSIERATLVNIIKRYPENTQFEVELKTNTKIRGEVSVSEKIGRVAIKMPDGNVMRCFPSDIVSIHPFFGSTAKLSQEILPPASQFRSVDMAGASSSDRDLDDIELEPEQIVEALPKLPSDPSSKYSFSHPSQLMGVERAGIVPTHLKGAPMTRKQITTELVGERVLGDVKITFRNGFAVSGVLMNDIIQARGWLINIDGEFSLHFSYEDVHSVEVKRKWPPLSEYQASPLTLDRLTELLQEVFKPTKKRG